MAESNSYSQLGIGLTSNPKVTNPGLGSHVAKVIDLLSDDEESPPPTSANPVPTPKRTPRQITQCNKCDGFGGVYEERHVKDRESAKVNYGSHMRMTPVKCDRCRWPRGTPRAWSRSRVSGEQIPIEDESQPDKEDDQETRRIQECEVCGEEKYEARFPTLITETCEHAQRSCKACVKAWISTQVKGKSPNVVCPSCPKILEHNDVMRLASKKDYDRYTLYMLIQTA